MIDQSSKEGRLLWGNTVAKYLPISNNVNQAIELEVLHPPLFGSELEERATELVEQVHHLNQGYSTKIEIGSVRENLYQIVSSSCINVYM